MTVMARALRLDEISTQITALLALASLIAFSAMAGVFWVYSERSGPPANLESDVRMAILLQVLDALPKASRQQVTEAFRSKALVATLREATVSELQKPTIGRQVLPMPDLPSGAGVIAVEMPSTDRTLVSARLSDGQIVAMDIHGSAQPPPFFAPLLIPLAFLAVSTALLSMWAGRRLVTPLARFARAVDQFDAQGNDGIALHEEGPIEIRRAARAFNRMRDRVVELVEDRTRTLMAISHDLRTPLTRLRLRMEDLPESVPRRHILEDLASMEILIASAVSYLREGASREGVETTDLTSLIETVCDQFADTGHQVVYDGPRHLLLRCRPQALGRAVTNLVDNATRFGSLVTVRVRPSAGNAVRIDVEDDGPGITDAEKQRVLEPFYRTDAARRIAGGFGLGLAIAKSIAEKHGGTLTLLDHIPQGLCARLSLPSSVETGSARLDRSDRL